MGNTEECSDHKIINKQNSCYEFDHDGKFCVVWHLMKQKYPHIKGMKDIASATLNLYSVIFQWIFHDKALFFLTASKHFGQLFNFLSM